MDEPARYKPDFGLSFIIYLSTYVFYHPYFLTYYSILSYSPRRMYASCHPYACKILHKKCNYKILFLSITFFMLKPPTIMQTYLRCTITLAFSVFSMLDINTFWNSLNCSTEEFIFPGETYKIKFKKKTKCFTVIEDRPTNLRMVKEPKTKLDAVMKKMVQSYEKRKGWQIIIWKDLTKGPIIL